jgi:hypothetical protein
VELVNPSLALAGNLLNKTVLYILHNYLHCIYRVIPNDCSPSTVAAIEISDRKDLNTLYKFRNLISVNRIFIKDYKVSVSIWHIRSESRVTFEMPQLSDLQKCVWLRGGVSIRAIAREINVDNVSVTFWETSLSIPFTKLKVWRCQSVWVFNGRNCS